jgi:hypothetical protein
MLSELKSVAKAEQAEAEQNKAFEDGAKATRSLFESYVAVGFTEEQSLYITTAIVTANMKK